MPPTASSHSIESRQAIEQALAELAWSLWTELGVSGAFRRHADWNIDLEPLILLTAALVDVDPRLRDESTDWCIRYARLVSAARLKTLVKHGGGETTRAFGEYAATVRAHVKINWPDCGSPRAYRPTGRSHLESLDRPALFGVRQRAIFGTSARAEIICALAASPGHSFAAAELADDVAFTKRAVEQELESLRLAGVVTWTAIHGRRRFRLARPDELLAFVGCRPHWFPSWGPIVRVLLGGLHLLTRLEALPPIVRAVESDRYLREIRADVERIGLAVPGVSTDKVDQWATLQDWLRNVTTALAAGEPGVIRRR